MATLEKPKQKKKKTKSSQKQHDLEENNLAITLEDEIGNIDVDFSDLTLGLAGQSSLNPSTELEEQATVQIEQTISKPNDEFEENSSISANTNRSAEEAVSEFKIESVPIAEEVPDYDIFLEESSLGFINVHTEELPVHSIVSVEEVEKPDITPSAPSLDEQPKAATQSRLYPEIRFPQNEEVMPSSQVTPQYSHLQHFDIQKDTKLIELVSSLKPFTVQAMNELYFNPYLSPAITFEDEFVNRELNEEFNYHKHPLYELLIKYQKSRQGLKINQLDINELKNMCHKHYGNTWSTYQSIARGEGYCSDRKLCKAQQFYEYAVQNNTAVEQLKNDLKSIVDLSGFVYSKNSYTSAICKLQIENRIREILATFPCHDAAPVVLTDNPAANLQELRLSLSILFSFLRKPNMDSIVISNVKEWILKLVALQLRYATWQDHLFLLYHILRCPSEISSWGAACIQIPLEQLNTYSNSPFESQAVHLCLTLLMALLRPIKKRKEFLGKIKKELIDPVQDNLWVLIDSDGEDLGETVNENGPKENDMVAVLNQIPLQKLFSCLTCAIPKDDGYYVNTGAVSGHHLIKAIVFSTRLVEMLGQGLKTYEDERYRQFCKRLARMIRHIVQYISEMQEISESSSRPETPSLKARIQLEYNILVLRSCFYIYNSQRIGTWQYLGGFPFTYISKGTLYKLYYGFLTGFDKKIVDDFTTNYAEKSSNTDLWSNFATNSIDIPSEDLYYLLQVFSTMTCTRNLYEWEFITTVTVGLYQIGFVHEATRDVCYKTVKDLIGGIAVKFPAVISVLLKYLESDISKIATFSPYLVKALPLDEWKPTFQDLEIIATWLLNFPFESIESQTARIIFNRLNWDFGTDANLFLSYDIHLRTACLICEVSTKHVPEIIGLSEISITNLVKNQTSRIQFANWCWNLTSRLRLHCMDQSRETVCNFLRDPTIYLQRIPEVEDTQILCQGVSESRPLAVYMSLLVSLIGHSVPQICHRGLEHIKLLLNDSRHTIVIRCLEIIVPLFLECPDSLSSCDKFQTILTQLLNDRSYQKYTKDFVVLQTQKPVLMLLGNMIQHQITNYVHYGLQSPKTLINLWFHCLTYNSSWYINPNFVHLLDLITKIAYQFPDAWMCLKEKFTPYFKNAETIKQNQSFGLMSLIGGGSSGSYNGLSQSNANTPWITLLALEIEFEILELQKGLWSEFLRQVYASNAKSSMDQILKKVVSLTGGHLFQANLLVMYKLASVIPTCNVDNPLFPIMCQQFFTLYLARIPIAPDDQRFYEVFGVADKFYEANITQIKKIKKKLQDAVDYHSEKSLNESDSSLFHNGCLKIFKAFIFWLEEMTLNKYHYSSVPSSVLEPHKLRLIFQGNRSHWTEYIDLPAIRKQQICEANEWAKLIQRPVKGIKQSSSSQSITNRTVSNPKANISERLESYGQPLPPPALFNITLHPPKPKTYLTNSARNVFQKKFKEISDYAKKFSDLINEHKQLDSSYLNLIQFLYKHESHSIKKRVACNNCTGSVLIQIQYQDSKLDSKIVEKLETNRRGYELVLKQETSIPRSEIVLAVSDILDATQYLADAYHRVKDDTNDLKYREKIQSNGIKLFYEMIGCMKEHIMACPISEDVCNYCADKLGILIRDNHNVEGFKLLDIALKRPDLINLIGELFCPTLSPQPHFIEMYEIMIDSHFKKCSEHTIFVLFSKFDVSTWLQRFKPNGSSVTYLLRLILKGLECWNQPHLALIQGLLRRHLIHVFEYDFPKHCLEILEQSLLEISERNFNPDVLYDLLDALYQKAGCGTFPHDSTIDTKNLMINFASKQNALSHQLLSDISTSFSAHFHNQRLQHGLHGLYPKHTNYIKVTHDFVGTISYANVNSCIAAYPSMMIENLMNLVWGNLCQVFSPWIIPYYLQDMPNAAANWIQQLSNNQVMLPWSQKYIEDAVIFLKLYCQIVSYVLETISDSQIILGYVLHQYDVAFVNVNMPKYIVEPLHKELLGLQWKYFKPKMVHIDLFNRILQQFLPESHAFIGNIFLKINWTQWFQQCSDSDKCLAAVLQIFVKLSLEPGTCESQEMVRLLEESWNYPWHLLTPNELEPIFDWFILSADPAIVLKIPTKFKLVDQNLLKLLMIVSGFGTSDPIQLQSRSMVNAKRLLYVRMITRLLRSCGTKYQQLLSVSDGSKNFNNAISDLLVLIDQSVSKNDDKERENDTTMFLLELLGSLPSQSEFTARLFVNALITWQLNECPHDITLFSVLIVLNSCKMYSHNMCLLIETTINNYLKQAESSDALKLTDWKSIVERMSGFLSVDPLHLIQNDLLLSLHLFLLLRLKHCQDSGDKIMSLHSLFMHLDKYKTNEKTEGKWFLVIGLFIQVGIQNLECSSTFMLPLARYLLGSVSQSDGWGDGILGAIGLKRDPISNHKRMLSRCLNCLIFSLYTDNYLDAAEIRIEYKQTLEELKSLISSKKFSGYREQVFEVISLLERSHEAKEEDQGINVGSIIRLFYKDHFLESVENVWHL